MNSASQLQARKVAGNFHLLDNCLARVQFKNLKIALRKLVISLFCYGQICRLKSVPAYRQAGPGTNHSPCEEYVNLQD